MRFHTSFTHEIEGTVIVSEPEGLTQSIIGLTRHPELNTLVKEFKTSMRLYGSNGTQDGRRDWLKNIESTYGPDSTIEVLIEYSSDGFTFFELYTGEVGIQTIMEDLAFDHGLEFTGVQNGFWRKAMSRWDVPVNIQAATNLDGEAVTVYSPENLLLPTQIIRKRTEMFGTDGVSGSDVGVDNNSVTVQIGLPFILEEISDSFAIPFADNPTPVAIIELKEAGDLTVSAAGDGRIEVTSGVNIDQVNVSLFARINSLLPTGIGASSASPGTPSCDETLPISGSHTFTGLQVGDTITIYAIFTVQLVSTDTINYTFGFEDLEVMLTFQSIFPDSNAPGFLVHDVIAAVLDRISDSDLLYSELLGSPATRARVYAEAGCYWNNIVAKGLHIRGYSLAEKQFAISMKDIWEGLNPHLNLSVGYEKLSGVDMIRLEERAHAYDSSSMSVLLSGVQRIKRKYSDQYFNSVETGNARGLIEDISGIDDPQKEVRANLFKNIGRKLTIVSNWITQSLTFEWTRRSTRLKSADNKFDNDNFMVEVTADGADYTPRLDEDYDSVTGLLNESTRYNKRWWPARAFLRWSNYIFNGCQNYVGTVYRFVSGEGNYDATSERKPDNCSDNYGAESLDEGGDITITEDHLYIPIEFEIEHYLTIEEFNTIDSLRNKAIGISQFAEEDGGHAEFFITDLQLEILSGQIKLTGFFKDPFNIETVAQGGTIIQGGKIFDATFDFSFE